MRKALLVMAASALSFAQVAGQKSLNLDGAKKVIAAAVAYAKEKNAPGAAIAVVDAGGHILAVERLDGTFPAGANISIGKARTAALFQRPTKVFEDVIAKGRNSMIAVAEVAPFTPLQGGVPVMSGGQVVGAVGVSGAASAAQDEEIAQAGAAVFSGWKMMSEVTYIDRDKVSAAFAKGAVLVNSGANYMVHASRRDQAGMAEVHTLDTDIIHVLDGTATLVTGGKVMDPKTVEPNEIRGRAIEGGERRQITKGDVIIVPSGVPHWFAELSGALTYYVVKVR
jgi:glc operon protein GlcG